MQRMTNVLRRVFGIAVLMVSVAPAASAQFSYTFYSGYTGGGNGAPFSSPICSGVVSSINFPDAASFHALCSATNGFNFGAQFSGTLIAPSAGGYTFGLTSDDGSQLFVDGASVVSLPGDHGAGGLTNNTVTLTAGSHSFLVNYYANTFGGSTLQATVDQGLTVTAVTATPEPASLTLLATGLVGLVAATRRRRKS